MDIDGNDGGASPSITNLLQFLRGVGGSTELPVDPIAQLRAAARQDMRLPKGGGLFGGGYARYMADNAGAVADPAEWWASAGSSSATQQPSNISSEAGSASVPNGLDTASAPSSAEAPSVEGFQAGLDPNIFSSAGPAAIGSGEPNGVLDRGLAGPTDGVESIDVVNSEHRRLRKQWEQRNGRPWPKDPRTGRNYDVAHIRAIADGGQHILENIRPLSRLEHLAEHMSSGDFARWARRPGIARAFGGTVASTDLGLLSDILGMISGRIRTDTIDNFVSDVSGFPSQEDQLKAQENLQKSLNPNWKRGDPIGI